MKILLLLTSIVLLSFCKNETTAGGSEIGSPTISGLFAAEDSSHGHARVRIFPHSYFMGMDSTIVVEGKTLTDGSFSLDIPDNWKSCNLLVETETGMMAAYTDMSIDSYDEPIKQKHLKPGHSLTITLQDSTGRNLSNIPLYFQGYPYRQSTNESGKAKWDQISEGDYQVFALANGEMKKISEINMGISPTVVKIIWAPI
jgi:hypothetical protein